MGSFRTWSLAAIAGIFVMVVAHQRSNADAGPAQAAAPMLAAAAPAGASTARVTGLPDFSGLVAEAGGAVVNVQRDREASENIRGSTGRGMATIRCRNFSAASSSQPGPDRAPPEQGRRLGIYRQLRRLCLDQRACGFRRIGSNRDPHRPARIPCEGHRHRQSQRCGIDQNRRHRLADGALWRSVASCVPVNGPLPSVRRSGLKTA